MLRAFRPSVVSLGYALFLAINATAVWGGVFPFRPLSIQEDRTMFWFFIVEASVFALAYLASVVGSYFFPERTKRFLVPLAGLPYVLAWICLIASSYVRDYTFELVVAGGALLGVGSAGFYMLWQRLFAALPPFRVLAVKRLGQAAPAHIPDKNTFFFRACLLGIFSIQAFEEPDGLDVVLVLDSGPAYAEVVAQCDAVVLTRVSTSNRASISNSVIPCACIFAADAVLKASFSISVCSYRRCSRMSPSCFVSSSFSVSGSLSAQRSRIRYAERRKFSSFLTRRIVSGRSTFAAISRGCV